MDALDEHDDPQDDDDVAIHRARAKAELDQIARDAKEALAAQGVAIDVFFLIPSSGNSVLIFGTPGDPSDDEWCRVAEVVGSIVAQSIGLDRVRCRPVTCATTESIADQPSQSPVQPSEPSPWRSAPMSTPALPHSGVDLR